jgi:RNA-directed DNA polymerase
MGDLQETITDETRKLIARQHSYELEQRDNAGRIQRRSGQPTVPTIHTPAHWAVDDGFDPAHVQRHAAGIAYAIQKALSRNQYSPRPALVYSVPKTGGGSRDVSIFQIADNALSRMVFKDLSAKNAPRLSSRCYAYRTDIALHDAVNYIASEFRRPARIFLAEFDFRKFFDSISHDHVAQILQNGGFLLTARERQVIDAFLRSPSLPMGAYSVTTPARRERGIPQGTSISLFLANAVALPLDRRLERLGVGFVRYADDTLIWSTDYSELCHAVDALTESALEMGVELNFSKSEGISILLAPGEKPEFKGKTVTAFLGYSISKTGIGITNAAIRRIKRRLAYLVYSNLLQAPLRGHIVPQRFSSPLDRDYLVMIQQIRRYLYGDLSENRLRRYLAKETPRIHYRGLMSFYPIVDDEELLKRLDGWLLHTVHTSLRKRSAILRTAGYSVLPTPHGTSRNGLLSLSGRSGSGASHDLSLPSFARVSRLLRKASVEHGPSAIANPESSNYY